jgi:hypothetical protein
MYVSNFIEKNILTLLLGLIYGKGKVGSLY